jgi:hypothetical protein
MASIGLDPARFGAHSLRIGGTTAALAAGLSPAAIRAAGRWASDVYMLYTRCNMQASQRLATVIGRPLVAHPPALNRSGCAEMIVLSGCTGGELPAGLPCDDCTEWMYW